MDYKISETYELVEIFNSQVGNRGWVSMRGFHNRALIDEFRRRGIDTSAVASEKIISFANHVRYDPQLNKLVIIL